MWTVRCVHTDVSRDADVVKHYARRGFFNIKSSIAQMPDAQTLRAPTFPQNQLYKIKVFNTVGVTFLIPFDTFQYCLILFKIF